MASSTPNDDWFQNAAAAQIRSERFERAELLNGRAAMIGFVVGVLTEALTCLLYTSPSPRDRQKSRMPSSA